MLGMDTLSIPSFVLEYYDIPSPSVFLPFSRLIDSKYILIRQLSMILKIFFNRTISTIFQNCRNHSKFIELFTDKDNRYRKFTG